MADGTADNGVLRRTAMQGALVAGVGIPLLAACGSDDDSGSGSDGSGSAASVKTSAVAVGGGVIVDKTVFVQPTEGNFKAYSAICPHQKCTFTEVTDGRIRCGGCHGAEFDAATGQNVVGPNGGSPNLPNLSTIDVTVSGDSVTSG